MNEMFNELADQFALGFMDYCLVIFGRLRDNEITIEESLEIYKKNKMNRHIIVLRPRQASRTYGNLKVL
jgi:hypothetical protein